MAHHAMHAHQTEQTSKFDHRINPLIDIPGTKYDSDTSIKVEDHEEESQFTKIEKQNKLKKLIKRKEKKDKIQEGDFEHFGYYSENKLYRMLRETFLVSTSPRIHRAGFRSHYCVLQERSRHLASFPWIIHPYSSFRFVWEILMTLLLLVTLVRQPLVLAYQAEEMTEPDELIVSIVCTILVGLDIVLIFRSGYVEEASDTIVLDPNLIAEDYIKSWLIVDIASTIPYDIILLIMVKVGHVRKEELDFFQYVRLLELMKIFRISRVIRYFTRFQEAYVTNTLYIRVINLHVVIFFTLHWLSCMHYLISDMFNDEEDPKENCWVTQLNLWNKSMFLKYINSVIRALSNMACLGYGNGVPREPEDIICTIVSIMIGATFFALFVGNLSSILINMDVAQKKYAELLNQVLEYMKFKQVPKELQHRVIMYYEQRYRRNFFNEGLILENISDVLREELQMFNCRALVEEVPLFQGLPHAIIQGIVARLQFEVYLPQDIIISTGTLGNAMYFIEHGAVSVLAPSGRAIARLRDGDFFGEMALITNERRNATVVATSFCDIYKLDRDDFEDVIVGYPEIYAQLIKMAEGRLQKLTVEPQVQKRGNANAEVVEKEKEQKINISLLYKKKPKMK